MLDQLQRKLKEFIRQSQQDKLFELLRKSLRSDSTLYNEILMVESSLSKARERFAINLINAENLRAIEDQVNYALLSFIDKVCIADLSVFTRKKIESLSNISSYHAFTCDRIEQNGKVLEEYYLRPETKVRHFFLYGDARQAHKSLFERFHRYFEGSLNDYDSYAQPSVRKKVVECQPCLAGNSIIYQIDFLNKVLTQCNAEPGIRQQLLRCTLSDLILHSDLRYFEPHDFVFILLTVNDLIWSDEIPKAVDALLNGFCQCSLDETAPNFFFFYGIEYNANKAEVKDAVKRAVKARADRIVELPELQPVTDDEVSEWLSRYPRLIPKELDAETMSTLLFGNKKTLDMIEVQEKLIDLIKKNQNELNFDDE